MKEILPSAYQKERLIRVLKNRLPEVNAVAGSMFVEIGLSIGDLNAKGTRTCVAHSALDNLIKGGAGQAVQSINLMLGLDENFGLLTPSQWP